MKYAIININNRAIENINHNKKILKDFTYIDDIEYFNGNIGNGRDVLNHRGIALNTWRPYDGRASDPLPGEYGVWVSTMNIFEYIINNNIDSLLVIEDDVILCDDFVEKLNVCISNLPEDYSFFSLYYFSGHNWIDDRTEIGSKYIHRSYNQYSAAQAMLYSFDGAKKLLKAFKRKGMEYTNDCFIYRQSLEGVVNGYSIKPDIFNFLIHDDKNIISDIDPDNLRNTR